MEPDGLDLRKAPFFSEDQPGFSGSMWVSETGDVFGNHTRSQQNREQNL